MTSLTLVGQNLYPNYEPAVDSYCYETAAFLSSTILQLTSTLAYEYLSNKSTEASQMLYGVELHGDPYLEPRQSIWERIQETASNVSSSCKSVKDKIFSGINYVKEGFSNSKSHTHDSLLIGLRAELPFSGTDLGEFNQAAVVVSDIDLSEYKGIIFPNSNLVNSTEFQRMNQIYQLIKRGDSKVKVTGTEEVRGIILSDIKTILSTQIGRDLIYRLHNNPLFDVPIKKGERSGFRTSGGEVFIEQFSTDEVFFGVNESDLTVAQPLRIATLFHELTHADNFQSFKCKNPNGTAILFAGKAIPKWTNQEELDTITKTNKFQHSLGMGVSRFWHEVYDSTIDKFQHFFNYKNVRIFRTEPLEDTIKRAFNSDCNNTKKSICPKLTDMWTVLTNSIHLGNIKVFNAAMNSPYFLNAPKYFQELVFRKIDQIKQT
jgi:hypothetical protein